MDFYDFLRQFVALDATSVAIVAVVVGGFVYGIIQAVDALVRNRPDANGVGLNPNLKYWGAVALSLIIPFFAWVVVSLNDQRPLTFGGVFLAGGVSFLAATSIHWLTGGSKRAEEAHEEEKVEAAVGLKPDAANDTGLS